MFIDRAVYQRRPYAIFISLPPKLSACNDFAGPTPKVLIAVQSAEMMQAHGALLGGEGNGGVIDPRVGYIRDSFAGMALLLDAMAARDLSVSRLADELPRYEIEKTKVTLDREKIAAAQGALRQHFADAEFDTLDGLRLDWPGRWLLVRASNTEPIVRAIAEAPTAEEARRLCNEAGEVLLGGDQE